MLTLRDTWERLGGGCQSDAIAQSCVVACLKLSLCTCGAPYMYVAGFQTAPARAQDFRCSLPASLRINTEPGQN